MGEVLSGGTFRKNTREGAIIAPATHPYGREYNGGRYGASISGPGNLEYYEDGTDYIFSDSDSVESNNIKWIKLSDRVMVADRNLLCMISWYEIYKIKSTISNITDQSNIIGATTGTTAIIDGHTYRIRLLRGITTSDYFSEWDTLLKRVTQADNMMHWQDCYSWCSDLTGDDGYSTTRPARGFTSFNGRTSLSPTSGGENQGFRPVLELLD